MRDAASPPRYQQILTVLRSRIADGAYIVGGLLPTESELCAEFGVSRYTVREALRRLAEQGLVERRQGSGTHVRSATPLAGFAYSVGSLREVAEFQAGLSYEVDAVDEVLLDTDLAALAPTIDGSETWLRAEGVRRPADGGDRAFHTRMYFPPRFSHLARDLDGPMRPTHALIEAASGELIVEVVQQMRTEVLSREIAERLGQPPHAWGVCLSRCYFGQRGGPLLIVVNRHPLDGFSYGFTLRRFGE